MNEVINAKYDFRQVRNWRYSSNARISEQIRVAFDDINNF